MAHSEAFDIGFEQPSSFESDVITDEPYGSSGVETRMSPRSSLLCIVVLAIAFWAGCIGLYRLIF